MFKKRTLLMIGNMAKTIIPIGFIGLALGCAPAEPVIEMVEVTREVPQTVEVKIPVDITRIVPQTVEVAVPVTVEVTREVTREIPITVIVAPTEPPPTPTPAATSTPTRVPTPTIPPSSWRVLESKPDSITGRAIAL